MQKKRFRQTKESRLGKIVSESGGKYTVLLQGQPYPLVNVPNYTKFTFSAGDTVYVGFHESDFQKPFILGTGSLGEIASVQTETGWNYEDKDSNKWRYVGAVPFADITYTEIINQELIRNIYDATQEFTFGVNAWLSFKDSTYVIFSFLFQDYVEVPVDDRWEIASIFYDLTGNRILSISSMDLAVTGLSSSLYDRVEPSLGSFADLEGEFSALRSGVTWGSAGILKRNKPLFYDNQLLFFDVYCQKWATGTYDFDTLSAYKESGDYILKYQSFSLGSGNVKFSSSKWVGDCWVFATFPVSVNSSTKYFYSLGYPVLLGNNWVWTNSYNFLGINKSTGRVEWEDQISNLNEVSDDYYTEGEYYAPISYNNFLISPTVQDIDGVKTGFSLLSWNKSPKERIFFHWRPPNPPNPTDHAESYKRDEHYYLTTFGENGISTENIFNKTFSFEVEYLDRHFADYEGSYKELQTYAAMFYEFSYAGYSPGNSVTGNQKPVCEELPFSFNKRTYSSSFLLYDQEKRVGGITKQGGIDQHDDWKGTQAETDDLETTLRHTVKLSNYYHWVSYVSPNLAVWTKNGVKNANKTITEIKTELSLGSTVAPQFVAISDTDFLVFDTGNKYLIVFDFDLNILLSKNISASMPAGTLTYSDYISSDGKVFLLIKAVASGITSYSLLGWGE